MVLDYLFSSQESVSHTIRTQWGHEVLLAFATHSSSRQELRRVQSLLLKASLQARNQRDFRGLSVKIEQRNGPILDRQAHNYMGNKKPKAIY